MSSTQPRSGYTLPVFACASAIAALHCLRTGNPVTSVQLNLIEPPGTAEIAIDQVARLPTGAALAITHSDPGDNLDLTRHTPIWAVVAWGETAQVETVLIQAGEGIGRVTSDSGRAAIYTYARQLLLQNLLSLLEAEEKIQVTLILPEGRSLAKRTSNEAFGVVEGLSLLGTTGISQPLSAPGQLAAYREELQAKKEQFDGLVFCVGENGLDLSQQMGIEPARLVKTANWLGPMLVEAGIQGVESILLFGYHGKLIKLAGGIFHTHHHVADGRLEILAAHCANAGLPTAAVQAIFACATAEAALQYLRKLDMERSSGTAAGWVETVYGAIAHLIDQRAAAYVKTHSDRGITIGTVLFDRNRQIIIKSKVGNLLLKRVSQTR